MCVCVCEAASYSTSYSGSETSTDVSMSSLENLSTSARQEPQGEETADLTSGLLDASVSSSLSSICADDKSSPWQSDAVSATSSTEQPMSYSQQPSQSSAAVLSNYRPVVSAGAANSLIRQLLQTSPQYSHLLSDLEPVCAGSPAGALEAKCSPKSALRGGGPVDGRSLPVTPPTTSAATSSPRSGLSTTAATRRLVNRYVNIDEDVVGRSLSQQQQRGYRDRTTRPSTAPSEHPPPATSSSLSVTRVKTVADPVERHRSFEVIDRVTGATLPRPSTASARRVTAPQNQHQCADSQPQQTHRTSPQHLERFNPALQHQQKVSDSAQSQQDHQAPATTTSTSSSLCVEQQCSTGDSHRTSPQTVW